MPRFRTRRGALCVLMLLAWRLWGAPTAQAWGADPAAAKPPADAAARRDAEAAFRDKVAPVFAQRCLSCHNSGEAKGGLSLQSSAAALRGGDSGPAIAPGDPDGSYLAEMIAVANGRAEMPKKADPLKPAEIEAIRAWIAAGAPWPADFELQEPRVRDTSWWSLQPLKRRSAPPLAPGAEAHNPIDAFVLEKLAAQGLGYSPLAERRVLARRLYFDLHGLPPAPDELQSFVADPDPLAYEKLVESLLASPRFGERWARHWLDVVRYGETHGYDKDKPRPNAWPYRDYVIQAFNADKPYGRFVQEQIAGDVLFPDTAEGVAALGFLSAGPWDFIGHVEVPESKTDGKIARHLDRDDMVSNTIGAFTGLTIHCAQCHNHKFDPITQEDYYSLQAVFAAIDRADRPYDADPETARRRLALEQRARTLSARVEALERAIKTAGGAALAEAERRVAEAEKPAGNQPPEFGYHSQIAATRQVVKWTQVDLGAPRAITRVVLHPCFDNFNNIGAGFGFPPRFKVEAANDADFQQDVVTLRDQTSAPLPNPGTTPQVVAVECPPRRYVRVTATELALRQNDYIFALAELQVFDAQGANRARGAAVTALDSIEAPVRWAQRNLVDGIHYRHTQSTAEELAKLRAERERLIDQTAPAETRAEHAQATRDLVAARDALRALPPAQRVYAGGVHFGDGAFSGTGPSGGKPRPIHILPRGDVQRPGAEVGPGALQCLGELPGRFELPPGHAEGERRAALARWLADARNALTWRVIANRLWQHHFGRGIVDTPNDFGRMGEPPTHRELLDWLALELRDGAAANGVQSLKHGHRLIVLSRAYRQTSATNPRGAAQDADNRWLWRMNRRRLDAESLRDSVLAVSGQLDLQMGGPSFQDFVIEKPEHSPHYQYHLHDPEDPRSRRRSVYRFIVRSQQQPFMTVFDCADPSQAVDKRNETNTPLQALALLNNQLTVVMARHFAARVLLEERARSGTARAEAQKNSAATTNDMADDPRAAAARAVRLALGRDPTAAELDLLAEHARRHGMASLCRLILNLNEFVFVD